MKYCAFRKDDGDALGKERNIRAVSPSLRCEAAYVFRKGNGPMPLKVLIVDDAAGGASRGEELARK